MGHPTKKPYLELRGKPILAHTIDVFDRHCSVDEIYIIVRIEDFQRCRTQVITPYGFSKQVDLIAGGDTRQKSVFNGVRALSPNTRFVIVHDGVRPFVTPDMISGCIQAADRWGAAVTAVPVKDTIKMADADQFVVETPDRRKLWAVQTPQAFRASLLLEAHQRAQRDEISATDDAALIERLGFRVKIVEGKHSNLKITTPEDLIIAEALLSTTAP